METLLMVDGPTPRKKTKKPMLAFRAPEDIEQWISSKFDRKAGIGMTEAMTWAMRLARDMDQGTREFDARIKSYAAKHDLTYVGGLKRVIAAGLDALKE